MTTISATNFSNAPKFAGLKLRNILQKWSTSPADYILWTFIQFRFLAASWQSSHWAVRTLVWSSWTDLNQFCRGSKLWEYLWLFCRAKISLGVSRLLIVTNRQYNGNALSNLYFRCLDWSQNNVWQVCGEWTFFTLLHVCGWAANNYKEVLKHTRSNWWPIPPDYPLWLWPFPNNLLQ